MVQQSEKPVNLKCPHVSICSVCPWLEISLAEQQERKIQALRLGLKDFSLPSHIPFHLPAPKHLRDRVDLTFANGVLGFYEKDRKTCFAPDECLQITPELFSFYKEMKTIPLPIKKGSLRLRAFGGLKGLWLDFANEDIKFLFQEKSTLQKILATGAIIEVGQRRKALQFDGSVFSLSKTARLEPWSQTFLGSGPNSTAVPLYSAIGSFTQSGSVANQVIIHRLSMMLANTTATDWLEFGCGNGNLTIPLAHQKNSVLAVEFDELSLLGFEKTLASLSASLRSRIIMKHGDFQRRNSSLAEFSGEKFSGVSGVLANPPRSGLRDFLQVLETGKVSDFIYMSCFLDSFAADAQRLSSAGYSLEEIEIIDQFPHTEHFEILARFRLA
jgi:23S rRNA (uracil1939-C5)-methyltransferase